MSQVKYDTFLGVLNRPTNMRDHNNEIIQHTFGLVLIAIVGRGRL